jgi:hypothetical protein
VTACARWDQTLTWRATHHHTTRYKRMRMHSDGSFPCWRCTRLSLACRPQVHQAAVPLLTLTLEKTDPRPLAEQYLRVRGRMMDWGGRGALLGGAMMRWWAWETGDGWCGRSGASMINL